MGMRWFVHTTSLSNHLFLGPKNCGTLPHCREKVNHFVDIAPTAGKFCPSWQRRNEFLLDGICANKKKTVIGTVRGAA
jgi:hypothetical protein